MEQNQKLNMSLRKDKLLNSKFNSYILVKFVSNMETQLNEPEDIIIWNFDTTTDMYVVSKGEVEVTIIDERAKIENETRSLLPGEYFGEISMIYQCRRTA